MWHITRQRIQVKIAVICFKWKMISYVIFGGKINSRLSGPWKATVDIWPSFLLIIREVKHLDKKSCSLEFVKWMQQICQSDEVTLENYPTNISNSDSLRIPLLKDLACNFWKGCFYSNKIYYLDSWAFVNI